MSLWAWALLCTGCGGGLVGFVVGAWRGERHDDAVWRDGYEEGHDDGAWAVQPEMAEVRAVQSADDLARPDQAADDGVLAVAVDGGRALPPGVPGVREPDRLGIAGRGYGPYLAAIGRDDPAGWYANLTAGEPVPEPGPEPEAAWLERQLYEGAVWSARLESWGSRFTDAFHADVAAWDRMAARWAEDARFMVESRRWPPKMLEAV